MAATPILRRRLRLSASALSHRGCTSPPHRVYLACVQWRVETQHTLSTNSPQSAIRWLIVARRSGRQALEKHHEGPLVESFGQAGLANAASTPEWRVKGSSRTRTWPACHPTVMKCRRAASPSLARRQRGSRWTTRHRRASPEHRLSLSRYSRPMHPPWRRCLKSTNGSS